MILTADFIMHKSKVFFINTEKIVAIYQENSNLSNNNDVFSETILNITFFNYILNRVNQHNPLNRRIFNHIYTNPVFFKSIIATKYG